jgi:hypothetical protein
MWGSVTLVTPTSTQTLMQMIPLRITSPVDWQRMLDDNRLFEYVSDQPGGEQDNGYDGSLHPMSSSHFDKMTGHRVVICLQGTMTIR